MLQLHSRFLPKLMESEEKSVLDMPFGLSYDRNKRRLFNWFLKESSSLVVHQLALQDTMEWMSNVSEALSSLEPVGVVVSQWSQTQYCCCGKDLARVVQQLEELCIRCFTMGNSFENTRWMDKEF